MVGETKSNAGVFSHLSTKRSREERYAEDSSSDEEAVQPKVKPTCATQKVTTKLVSSSESESELGEADGEGVDTGIPHQSTAGVVPHSSSHTISVSISIFSF